MGGSLLLLWFSFNRCYCWLGGRCCRWFNYNVLHVLNHCKLTVLLLNLCCRTKTSPLHSVTSLRYVCLSNSDSTRRFCFGSDNDHSIATNLFSLDCDVTFQT